MASVRKSTVFETGCRLNGDRNYPVTVPDSYSEILWKLLITSPHTDQIAQFQWFVFCWVCIHHPWRNPHLNCRRNRHTPSNKKLSPRAAMLAANGATTAQPLPLSNTP